MTCISESTESKDLEQSVLKVFEKLKVMVNPANVEDWQWIKTSNSSKKVIIKLSKRKDAAKIRSSKTELKGIDLSSIAIRGKVYISDSLCKYYKFLWKKFITLQSNQFIHFFWVTTCTVRLKAVENGRVHVITHLSYFRKTNYSAKKIRSNIFAYIFMFYFIFKNI